MDEAIEEDTFTPQYLQKNEPLFSWMKSPACLVLFMFVVSLMSLYGAGQQQMFGIILVFGSFIAVMIRSGHIIFPLPLEMKMYIAWVIWASITGPFVAMHKITLWHGGIRQLLQVTVMIIAVYCIIRIHKTLALKAMAFGLICGATLQALVARSSVSGLGANLSNLGSTERAMGLADNSNTLGMMMIWGLLGMFLLWRQRQSATHKLIKFTTCGLLPIFIYGVLASGSRKVIVSFIFVLLLWLLYAIAPRVRARAIIWRLGMAVILVFTSGPVIFYLLNNTLAGKRMMAKSASGASVVEAEETRMIMYQEGLGVFFRNPLLGVGVNQFQYYSESGLYSHSNYIEPLACTGLLGFILFQGIFIIPLVRAWRLNKQIQQLSMLYLVKVVVIANLSILLLGLGSPFYSSTMVMTLIAALSAITYAWQQEYLQSEQLYLDESEYSQI